MHLSRFVHRVVWLGLLGWAAAGTAQTVPCPTTLGITKPRFCVSVSVVNGYLTIVGRGELHALPSVKFDFGKYGTQQNVETALNHFVAALFHKQRLFELMQSVPQSGGPAPTIPPTVPPAAKTISGSTLNEALKNLKSAWPDCPECDDTFVTSRLNALFGDLGMKSDTPFSAVRQIPEQSILAFDVEPPSSGLNDAKNLTIGFDLGAPDLNADGRLRTSASVRHWIVDQFDGRFWIASIIRTHFNGSYQAVGLTPTIIVSFTGVHPRKITIAESLRIGRITFPGDGKGSIDPNAGRIANLLLRTDQWSAFQAAALPATGGGTKFPLCLPRLTGGKCAGDPDPLPADQAQPTLDYLSAFWLAERTADLQALGYTISTVNEENTSSGARNGIAAIDLSVQKLANSAASATSTPSATTTPAATPASPSSRASPTPSPGNDPATTADLATVPAPPGVRPVTRLPEAQNAILPKPADIVASSAPRVNPVPAGTTPSVPKDWLAEYGIAVQYRSNQGVRVLLQAQTRTLRLGPAVLSLSGQAGTDVTKPFGLGNFNADWLWFDKIRRRLQVNVTGSTDATSHRILGGAYTDERRTGGNAHAQLELFHDERGLAWSLFATPDRESVSLTRTGTPAGGGNLNTLTLGSGIVYDRWITNSPMRFTLNSQARVGSGLGADHSAYVVFDVDGTAHRRISNTYVISTDVTGRYQAASASTPVFELPSLGGGESVRGFQTDDALGRNEWSVQSELWVPVPGTLGATETSGVSWFLRQNVRLAGFLDFGGVNDTSLLNAPGLLTAGASSPSGWRRGTGAGIRFVQGLIALKLDWAYGFGQGAFGPGHGRFYLGIGTNGSF